jgi:hypothetical protein
MDYETAHKPAFRFGLRRLFVIVAIFAVLCLGLRFVHQTLEVPRDAYAMWDGALLVIDHIDSHNGHWPTGWEDIESALRKGNVRTFGPESMEELKERLIIDFDVDPVKFAAASPNSPEGLPKVIRLRNGRNTYWEHAEPNALVHDHLNQKIRRANSQTN